VDAPRTETRAIIASDGEDCVAAFRGTHDLRDWLTDLDCAFGVMRVEGAELAVHAGFKQALESVWEELNIELQSMARAQRFWLTGHSLGGALALLCARCYSGPLAGVYTFGQPRAGGGGFAARYDAGLRDRTFRIVHAADIVPRVPWLPGDYRHAGHEIFFPCPFPLGEGQGESFRLDPPWWLKVPTDIRRLARQARHGKLAMLDDHHLAAYVQLVSSTSPHAPALNYEI
jgi:triacylglycerol lipase